MNYANLAQKTNFIAGSERFNNLPFFLTSVNIPGINMSHNEIGGRDSIKMRISSDTITYNSLSFEMLIDEDFLIYQELLEIIYENVNVKTGTFKDFVFEFFIELNNSKGHKILKINFENCRIESIGDIELDTTDEITEHTLAMEMVFDKFEIEETPRYQSEEVVQDPEDPIVQIEYTENFDDISAWTLWGFPSPVLSNDEGCENGTGFDSNGAGQYESGAVQNNIEIPVVNPFEFKFRVKQPLGADTESDYYLNFGLTEGICIESTSNGRTGSTIMGIMIDGGLKNPNSIIKHISYQFKNVPEYSGGEYSNDGQFHEFTFKYTPGTENALYEIYKDDVLVTSCTEKISRHEHLFLFIQGKSEGGIQVLDWISGTYGEV